jgi:thiol:disulfide interchange protein DsbA
MKRFVLLLSTLLPLAACNQTAPPPTDTANAPAATPAATTPSAAAQAAAASAAAAANAGAATETPAATTTAQPAASAVTANAGGLAAGTDYVEIQGGQPYLPRDGKIEVVEVFNYICPACARFEPMLSTWKRQLPPDVRLSYVPAAFGPQWQPYAQAFLVADGMGIVERSHEAVFNAIHIDNTLPGEGQPPDEAKIGAFYAKYGANPKQFVEAMHSFATDAKLNRAKQFMIASGVEGTPTMIIDGKYRVLGKSYEDVLRIANQLIARERAARGGTAGQ